MNKKITTMLVSLVLFSATAAASYLISDSVLSRQSNSGIISPVTTGTPKPSSGRSRIDPSIPRTEVCPLNGDLYTKQERDVWMTRRPLAVMIENSVDARPQSGLSTADVVYEAVAEGGITRFMGVYYCGVSLAGNVTLAPVRSARIYYVSLVSEYNALYNHVGGAGHCTDPNVDDRAKALCLISRAGIKNLDQMGYAGEFKTCHRLADRLDKEVAYEHTMACFTDGLYAKAAKLGWNYQDEKKVPWDKNFVSWKFLGKGEKASGLPATNISYMFWETNRDFNSSFDVSWRYDAATDSYERSNGGSVSTDLNTGEPLRYKTVVVQFAKETFTGDLEKHMLYQVEGKGDAIVFQNGVATKGTWSKASRTSRTLYKDAKGVDIKFTPGPIWISIVPSTNTITYN